MAENSTRFGKWFILAVALVSALVAVTVWATGTVTVITGSPVSVSADTARDGGSGAFTALATGPRIVETDAAGMSLGSVTLNAPAGFEFDTTSLVNVQVINAGGTSTARAYINSTNSTAGQVRILNVTPSASAITFYITTESTGVNNRSSFTWTGIKVRPTQGTPLASGNITYSGSSTGVAAGTNMGTLTVIPGALHHFALSTVNSPQVVGSPFPLTITAQDQFGNTATGFTGTTNLAVSAGSTISPATTGSFIGGVWNGNATVSGAGAGRIITAISGTVSGTSNPFDVAGTSTL